MMKKCLPTLICLLALCAVCLAEEALPAAPVFEWERDLACHWRTAEDGAKADQGAHTLDDSLVCTVCGAEIWAYDDRSGEVCNYDEQGNLVRQTSFDSEGAVTYESVRALTYDESGALTHALEYIDGVLFCETAFGLSPDGEIVPVSECAWYDDGAKATNEYDEYGNCVRAVTYDADGSVMSETLSEYAQDDWGWFYESRTTTRMDESVFISEYNRYGDRTRTLNSDGGLVWADYVYEYEYDGGVKRRCLQYDRGRLSRESIYDPETGMLVLETEYYDDGTATVSEFNPIGDPVCITFLAADGTADMTQTCEYVYDASDMQLSCRTFVDGVPVLFSEYAEDENGWRFLARETLYNEDGSCTVMCFDEHGEIVSETDYDAQGRIVR